MTQPQNVLDSAYAKARELAPTFTYRSADPLARWWELADAAMAALHGSDNIASRQAAPTWEVYQHYLQPLREAWPTDEISVDEHLLYDLRDLRGDYDLTDEQIRYALEQSPAMNDQARKALAFAVANYVHQYIWRRLRADYLAAQ